MCRTRPTEEWLHKGRKKSMKVPDCEDDDDDDDHGDKNILTMTELI